ncbi:hypothetical protein LTR56_000257 [Elasticomyces elasticus]|nr:hypothetical protein LTR22_022628 [Elasticomyces elasticus]KAK3661134.1 hypothetical protein LTR56_000257 [Elasticomyces elasticus]KAK4911693.1 hypothetical protein LTR49_019772 [Elasticomyces elasticus]KAK5751309.1 hypothetical protein LTS12_018625 [Elasticomyces elasticus]
MTTKTITILGITGKQGASVADVFLAEGDWHIRGVTRDVSKPAAKALAEKHVELFEGDVNDVSFLKSAFAGSNVVFGVTDFWGITRDPDVQARAAATGKQVNMLAYDIEVQQGRNILEAANATLDTLDRFVLSTLSATKKWSKGKYFNNYHFDAKWDTVEHLKANYPELNKKSSYLQMALYLTNWKEFEGLQFARPLKQSDGTYLIRIPGDVHKPIAQVDARRDTGKFTRALLDVPAEVNALGAGGIVSWSDFASLWGKHHGVDCRVERLNREVLEQAIPGGIGAEFADMFEYAAEFGYTGGDPTVVLPEDVETNVSC